MDRSEIKMNWPYHCRSIGVVFRDRDCKHQEALIRKMNPGEIDDDLMLFVEVRTNKRVFVALRLLVDF